MAKTRLPKIDEGRMTDDLMRLVRLPSVAFEGFPAQPLQAASELAAELLGEATGIEVERIQAPGGATALFVDIAAGGGVPAVADPAKIGGDQGPTVLLYAHYDVQPAGEDSWTAPPFEPELRDGRLYGRGTADDKWAIALHAAVMRAFAGKPPVRTKILIEGDEETGAGSLTKLVEQDPEKFRADVFVIADAGNVATGKPTLTTSLRGITVLDVTVSTLRTAVHSGEGGGPLPDSLIALSRMIASLHNADGSVAVQGLRTMPWHGEQVDPDSFAQSNGLLEGVQLIGEGTIAQQTYVGPAISVIGIDAPAVDVASNIIIPQVRARVSCRLAPNDDPREAAQLIESHLREHAPWGVQLEFEHGAGAVGAVLDGEGPGVQAALNALQRGYGTRAVKDGCGGAIPLCADLSNIYPNAEFILWGAGDDRSQIHAADESIDLKDLKRHAISEAALLLELAGGVGGSSTGTGFVLGGELDQVRPEPVWRRMIKAITGRR